MVLVEHSHIVDNDTIEETKVYSAHTHFSSEFLAESVGNGRAKEGLYWWQMQQYDEQNVEREYRPYDAVDDMLKAFQSVLFFIFLTSIYPMAETFPSAMFP